MNMPLEPSWSDITVRLALTPLASAIIGFKRGAHGDKVPVPRDGRAASGQPRRPGTSLILLG